MTNRELARPGRKLLWVSDAVHASVQAMQKRIQARSGYKPTQSEVVRKGLEALEREQEAEK